MSDIFISASGGRTFVGAYINNKLEHLSVVRSSELSNIYLCRVENVVKNISAAFVRYGDMETGYLSLKDIIPAAIVNRSVDENKPGIRQGDEIIAQLDTESIKQKKPKFSTRISISGKYSVVTLGRKGVGASTRLSNADRTRLIGLIKEEYEELASDYRDKLYGADFGIIIRTESAEIPETDAKETITADIRKCLDQIVVILNEGRTRTVFSCLHRGNSEDLESHIASAERFLKSRGISDYNLTDSSVIYNIDNDLKKLLTNRVWLKSGAFLIIEQLESFNAIDVNTGKAIAGKNDIIKKINFEAAEEIFRQIRLRNLSGMILIDFINMKSAEDESELCESVRNLCRKEAIHTEFIDITGLGIIELIRTKNEKSLKEILENQQYPVDNKS
jgi:ribonuclease G